MMTLEFILSTLMDYRLVGRESMITTVVIDSREARPGSLFFAFKGEKVDGHEYVGEAFARGAIAAVIEHAVQGEYPTINCRRTVGEQDEPDDLSVRPLCILVDDSLEALQLLAKTWRSRFQDLRVIGITGSVGKTTSKELIHAVLAKRYKTIKSEGNYNNEIGLPLTLLNMRPWHERAVLEMGMYTSGEISLLCDIAQPQVGVVTLVGSVHMEWLGSIEAIAEAKRELVEALPAAPEGVAILNMDDPRVMAMANYTQARIFSYGLNANADIWADNIISMGLDGIHFILHQGYDRLSVQVPLLGRHSVHTALRAAAVGRVEGMRWEDIINGLQGLTSQLRLVAVPGPRESIILDDTYNSSPESAVAALNLLAELSGRRIAVLGDMLELGPVEESSHRLVGRRAREVASILVAVGELGQWIGEEAIKVGLPVDRVFVVHDSEAAVSILEKIIEPKDVILVKGSRGVEMDRIVSELGQG